MTLDATAPDAAAHGAAIQEGDVRDSAIPSPAVQATAYTRNRTKPNVDWRVAEEPNRPRERRKEHDELTAELVHMARRLKSNNFALRDLVERDREIVNKADLALGVNAGRFKDQHRDLQSFSSKSWATTWKLILLTVFVLISLLLTFMLIVVTKSS
ncbi:hypothetical protein PSACC_02160 [Paramicrosporidium saccamoebae]|uniref:Uncharacterized protein n=1 Tax=Paramicrosporidium saccamoebae TaxID=1246581 RepID=A0A2H9TJV7_9FUNG|nr:hypothetical protein PSACC_02160 [Paramicrosporidium saccamoebae]